MIDVWINNGFGWITELTESHYINISTYRLLSGSLYMDLPVEWRIPRNGLINIKNKDKKCFLYFSNKHPERIQKMTKKELNYTGTEFPV